MRKQRKMEIEEQKVTKDRENKNAAEMKQMKRRKKGDKEGIERMREIPVWREDSPLSGPQEACQGLNYITLHVIYFMALGGCPMCLKMRKILTAILTLHYS